MRIVHMLAPAPAGGLERVVQALAIGQHRRGHDVVVVPVAEAWSPDHPFAAPLHRVGIAVQPVVVGPRDYAQERRMLAAQLDAFGAELVHSHGYHTNVVGGPVVRRKRIAVVGSAHGFTGGSLRNRLYEWLDCNALRQFDATIAVSRPLADQLAARGVRRARLHVVPNAWSQIAPPLSRAEARAKLQLPHDATVVGWVGRMTREKGLDVFVDALCDVRTPGVIACVIGDGVERRAQEERSNLAGLGGRIHWAGLVQEAGRYFNAFDVLCQSSRTEGIPMVILEAMAMSVPLVVTGVGGVPDVVSSTEAQIIASEDSVALARALDDTLVDRVASTTRASMARARLDRDYSEAAWLDGHDKVYELARRHSSARSS